MIQILWARSIRIYGNQANCWLAGGRSCSVFAECREVQKDDQQVLWQFRLQEHDANGEARIALSEGHIRVINRPQ